MQLLVRQAIVVGREPIASRNNRHNREMRARYPGYSIPQLFGGVRMVRTASLFSAFMLALLVMAAAYSAVPSAPNAAAITSGLVP